MRARRKLSPRPRQESHCKPVKHFADYQIDWASVILPLRNYKLEKVTFLSVMGDAPKDFITDRDYRHRDYRPGHRSRHERIESHIAKVGAKYYPNESITEHFITRIGQCFDMSIADSKLRLIDGQVRFMSKYFLRNETLLTHGAEIFELCLGKEDYAAIAEKKIESEFFTFQIACEEIKNAFLGYEVKIIRGLVEMLAFDALIGHNDRHPYNWGVVVPLRKGAAPRFSPVFDTARALFWNKSERYVRMVLTDKRPLLENYIRKCKAPLSWDGEPNVDFFRLIGLIWNSSERYRSSIEKFLAEKPLKKSFETLDKEFRELMSAERRELIKRCLRMRQKFMGEAIAKFK